MFKTTGKIVYDPTHKVAKFLKWTMILRVPDEITAYYRYWIKRELGIQLNVPCWRSHVTIVRGQRPLRPHLWNQHAGREIEIEYSGDIHNDGKYFWLPVKSQELSDVREELGLSPYPKIGFHVTTGNAKNLIQQPKKLKPYIIFPWEN